ncbi:AT-hook motif nuclear-localized protein 14-like isoform X3 [Olea europaea var. sylvestris]|uniref:AT-hook motif nuclear-localized protein 14-like isoform X3 n=1 Tax=Olea europaea var. sylvestris TaxID=158386 RepID=UPI000C1D26F1|nr:AT-hook motif nuclear-localized protein 14-like isoform X3 [Olea europaea var. sylvestris]
MEPNNDGSGLSSYFHHQLHSQSPPPPPTSAVTGNLSQANGVVPNSTTATNMAYLHSVPSAVSSPLETVKRKRGRPRKYGTPEQAAAAKRLSGSSVPKKRDNQDLTASAAGPSGPYSYSSKKPQFSAIVLRMIEEVREVQEILCSLSFFSLNVLINKPRV